MTTAQQPNVLFVFADQLRATALSCAGNPDVRTPNIDRLAANGAQFDHACANYPLCTPSRASIVSGQHAQTNTVVTNDLALPTSAPSVASEFGEAGYRCGYIGKWHLDGVPRDKWTPPGERRHGFDDYWAAYNCTHDYFDAPYYTDDPRPKTHDEYEPVGQTDLAVEYLSGVKHPFCLFLSWGPPHDPYELVPDEYRAMYDPAELELRPNAAPILPSAFPPESNRPSDSPHPAPAMDFAPPIRAWETGERCPYTGPREVLADYYAAVTALDDQLGRLLDALKRNALLEDTIVVFTADHGDMLWSQGLNQKGSPYEESIRVPFIVHWPAEVPDHRVTSDVISTVDFAPTLLGLAGQAVPDEMDGTDLSDVVLREDSGQQEAAFIYNLRQEWRGVRTLEETYVRVRPGTFDHLPHDGGDWLLYDNAGDPFQFENRIFDASCAERRDELERLLSVRLSETEDDFGTFEHHVRAADVREAWNEREREMHPDDPKLV
jgi:arylsulfatase A-like enzyme